MSEINVTAQSDYLQSLAKSVKRGLVELVWNAFDADASNVSVTLERNSFGGVDSVLVTDDGNGMDGQRVSEYFGLLGGSWKSRTEHTAGGRTLHGRKGQGRFAAFALGNRITWDTTYRNEEDGTLSRTIIAGNSENSNHFSVTKNMTASGQGTTVKVENVADRGSSYLDGTDAVVEDLALEFAAYLATYKVNLSYEGTKVDPLQMADIAKISVQVIQDGNPQEFELEIWEWRKPVQRRLYLCDESGIPIHEMSPGIQAPGFNFTAYAKWDQFREHQDTIELEDNAETPVHEALEAIKSKLTAFFLDRKNRQNTQLIESWKEDGLYPFEDIPAEELTPEEQTQRRMFDLVAVTAKPAINEKDKPATKLTLKLLRSAIDTNPASVNKILGEVISLSKQETDDLAELLEKTTLGGMISAAKLVADRLEFLSALRTIVSPGQLKKQLKERSQLQKILLGETWIFGEEYALIASDQALLTVLRENKKLLEPGILIDDQRTIQSLREPVKDPDGRNVIPDLMFSSLVPQSDSRRRHLVIELKRPSVSIGVSQMNQIQNYALTISNDERFDHDNTWWDFWIVGDKIDDQAKRLLATDNNAKNVYRTFENTIVRCVTWGEIIQQAEYRMKFLKNKLDYDPDSNAGIRYLNQKHSEYLPADFKQAK